MAEDFSIDIDKWCQEAGSKAAAFPPAFAMRLIAYIKSKTPVLTGNLRASIGSITPLGSYKPGQGITIGTNVEYARRIEYGFVGVDKLGRRYDQKGVGMFAQAIAAAPDIAEDTLQSLQSDRGVISSAIIGAAVEGVWGAVVGGPVGAFAGVMEGAAYGVAEAEILPEGVGSGTVGGGILGAVEGAVIGGPVEAIKSAVQGAIEGAIEPGEDPHK